MNINFNKLDNFVMKETLKAIKEALDPHLTEDNSERRRQERMAKAVLDRDLNAGSGGDETNEAEDEEAPSKEPENLPTGVPATTDKNKGKETSAQDKKDDSGGKGTKDSPKLATPSNDKFKNPTVGSVIDKLNALRGGRSLKDPQVKKSFSQYFDNLTSSEKGSLLVFLTGISQILAGVATGSAAPDPGDIGIRVHDTKPQGSDKKSQKAVGKSKTTPSGTESTPILVGEQQQKYGIKKILETYKRYE